MPQPDDTWESDYVMVLLKDRSITIAYYGHDWQQWFKEDGEKKVKQEVIGWRPLDEKTKFKG